MNIIELSQIGKNGVQITFSEKKEIFIFEEEELFNLLKKYCGDK